MKLEDLTVEQIASILTQVCKKTEAAAEARGLLDSCDFNGLLVHEAVEGEISFETDSYGDIDWEAIPISDLLRPIEEIQQEAKEEKQRAIKEAEEKAKAEREQKEKAIEEKERVELQRLINKYGIPPQDWSQ